MTELFDNNPRWSFPRFYFLLDNFSNQAELMEFVDELRRVLRTQEEWYKMQIAHCIQARRYFQKTREERGEFIRSLSSYTLCPEAEEFLLTALKRHSLAFLDGHLLVKGLKERSLFNVDQGRTAGLCLRNTIYPNGLHFQAGVWYRPRDLKQARILLQQSRVSEVDWIAVRPLYPFWLTKRDDQTQLLARLAKLIK